MRAATYQWHFFVTKRRFKMITCPQSMSHCPNVVSGIAALNEAEAFMNTNPAWFNDVSNVEAGINYITNLRTTLQAAIAACTPIPSTQVMDKIQLSMQVDQMCSVLLSRLQKKLHDLACGIIIAI